MFKVLLPTLKWLLLLSFIISPTFVFAYNSMCYSPVQMAALLSPPKRSVNRSSNSRAMQMRASRAIDKIEERLDEQQGNLADSLDKDKFTEKRNEIAKQIRRYIENDQDGWNCDSSSSSIFLPKSTLALFFFQSPLLLDAFAGFLIPAVFADVGSAPDEETEDKVVINPNSIRQRVPDNLSKTRCQIAGRTWNSTQNKCCPNGQGLSNGNCVAMDACVESGGGLNTADGSCYCDSRYGLRKSGNRCVCLEGQSFFTAQKRCCPRNSTAQGSPGSSQCVSNEPREVLPQSQCQRMGRVWSSAQNKCCLGNEELYNNKCVKKCEETETRIRGICIKPATPAPEEPTPEPTPVITITPEEPTPEPAPEEPAPVITITPEEPTPEEPTTEETSTPCPEWKKDKAFKSNGRVSSSFCDRYAKSGAKRNCKRALQKLKDLNRKLAKLEKKLERLEDQAHKDTLSSLDSSTTKTEAGGLCFDCLKKVMKASQPSTSQSVGNMLNILTGAGIGLIGYKTGKRAQQDLNMLRIQEGYEAQNDYYSLMGASAGMPYMAKGFYGMTRANTPIGGWSCSPTISPYGHSYNYQYGQGFNMGYY